MHSEALAGKDGHLFTVHGSRARLSSMSTKIFSEVVYIRCNEIESEREGKGEQRAREGGKGKHKARETGRPVNREEDKNTQAETGTTRLQQRQEQGSGTGPTSNA